MKKVMLTLVIVMIISAVSTPVAIVEEAHAMGGLGCTTAADFGWENWNWNQICYYELAILEPVYDDSWDDFIWD